MNDYGIKVRVDSFTTWYNQCFGTNFPFGLAGVPNREWNEVMEMLNMTGRADDGYYILVARDGGAMARQMGLDKVF